MFSYNLYAYCSSNPVMYSDHTGESWLGAIVGAAINVATTFVSAVVTGQDYSLIDAGAAAAAGAASGLGFVGAVSGGIISGIGTFISSLESESTIGEAFVAGLVTATFSTISISTMVAGDKLGIGVSAMVGLSFGFASNLMGASVVSGIKNK